MKLTNSVLMFSLLLVFPLEAKAEKKVGIFLFSDETRYTIAAQGIMDKLKENGFREPTTKFMVMNAEYNKANAVEHVKKFIARKMDLIFTVGTSATVPIAREIKDTPIVFAIVYDPIAVGIAKDWKKSGNNTTGASSNISMSSILDALKTFKSVKKLAVLYTPDEKNSEVVLKDLQEVQSKYKISIIPVPLTTREEIVQILPEVLRTSDALYVTGSNLVDSQVSAIVDMATQAKVVTITHLEDLVEKGVLLGVCSDPYLIGRMAGEKGIKILKGAKPSSIPIETPKENKVIINMKTARAGQFQIPKELMSIVKKKIE
jgi:putative ABC transport system substrate-binding protein